MTQNTNISFDYQNMFCSSSLHMLPTYIVTDGQGVRPGCGGRPACQGGELPPAVLHQVDVEVDWAAQHRQQVRGLAEPQTPARPRHLPLAVRLRELPDVGHPPHSVTHDEDFKHISSKYSWILTPAPLSGLTMHYVHIMDFLSE